jgi:hypothetical protein
LFSTAIKFHFFKNLINQDNEAFYQITDTITAEGIAGIYLWGGCKFQKQKGSQEMGGGGF